MMQKRLLFLVAAYLVSSEDESCVHHDTPGPCHFSLIVRNCKWREGSRVGDIECRSSCTGTESDGFRYKLDMLLDDKLIKKNEPRFEPDCYYVPIINSISPALSKCSLTVENVSRDDKGRLDCILYRDGTRLGGNNCTIKVLCKLSFGRTSDLTLVQMPDDGAVVAGSSFSMTCYVNSGVYPLPIIRWVHNKTRVVKTEKKGSLFSTYNVSFLNETNAGGYECWVQNEQGNTTKNLPHVFEAAVRPEITNFSANIESHNDVVVAWKGRAVVFRCTGNGNPAPNVTVTHVKSDESSLPQLVGGGSATAMFSVTSASRVDNGAYVCQAENKVDFVYANVTLIVCESPPSISFYVSPEPSSSSRCVPVDGGFSLKCLAHGCPNPSIELIPPASTEGIIARNGEAVYKITNGSPNGAYVCRVANVCGSVSNVHQLCTTDAGTPDICVIVISTVAACLFAVLLAVILWPVAKRLHHSSRRVRRAYGVREYESISSDTSPIVAANQDSGTVPPQMPD